MDPNYRPFIDGVAMPPYNPMAQSPAHRRDHLKPPWLPASDTELDCHLELSFVTEAGLGSWLIRQGTHSDFSHVDIILPDSHRFGARHNGGVQSRPFDYADFTKDCRLVIPCSEGQAEAAYEWLYAQTGKPYDTSGLLQSFILNRRRDWRGNEDTWWCSELATVFVEKAGFPRCKCPANGMAPNDAYIYVGCFAI